MKAEPPAPISRRSFIKNTSYTTALLSGAAALIAKSSLAGVPPFPEMPVVGQPLRGSHPKNLPVDPLCPFPVGVEYYRPPMPLTKFWDEDFKRIRASGMRIVRSFFAWDSWVEPTPGKFVFDDVDLFFDLAAKHGLKCWFDTAVGTHMACPTWVTRKHPDMRVVWNDGRVQEPTAGSFSPHGTMIHNFDHPMWRVYVERYIRALVPRYKDHPSMFVWGTWDGINTAAAWALGPSDKKTPGNSVHLPYNDYTIEKYRTWLKQRYTLGELNDRLFQRFESWEDVDAPRSNDQLVEMLMYKKFHYENMADHLGWLGDLIDRLDGKHEQRSHGTFFPRQWDEIVSPRIDSWGLSHNSNDQLSSDDPYSVALKCFGFQWCRAIGRNGRWWNEEIYSSYNGGLRLGRKITLPEEATTFLWLSLIEGAVGAMYWQYRPEYSTFEAPGLNLTTLSGRATPRLAAVQEAIRQIDAIAPHLPLTVPKAEMAIGYSAPSFDIFEMGERGDWFKDTGTGVYRALWQQSIPQDIVTPAMDWSAYKAVCLPNFALLDDKAVARIRGVLENPRGPSLLLEGHFGTFAGKGHWSFFPPEGLSDLIDIEIDDFTSISPADIHDKRAVLSTTYGDFPIVQPCQYAILRPGKNAVPIARIGADVVGARSTDGRVIWFGVPLLATGSPAEISGLALKLLSPMGIRSHFAMKGDKLIGFRRGSKLGGSLIFLHNLERKKAVATVKPLWKFSAVTDLLRKTACVVGNDGFQVELSFGEVGVFHCQDS
ncbi:MAG: hypothetical protein EXS38_04425 [Opitutus sp.]|nr:hypothetical protein [Opitutus sp.]